MAERQADARVDLLVRLLDVPATPPEEFATASTAQLLPHARRARAQDRRLLGRLIRDLRASVGGPALGASPMRGYARAALTLVVLALLVLGLLVVIGGSRRRVPAPFGFASNGEIAYVNGGHIYLTDSSASGARQVTFEVGVQVDPTFSRDGLHLAYRRYPVEQVAVETDVGDVVVLDADGSHPVVVASGVGVLSHPAWSPDGRFIAFSGSIAGAAGGWIAPADGSAAPTRFTSRPQAWDPVWSPDGARLLFGDYPAALWMVDRDGTNARRLTRGDFYDLGQHGEIADWSPDGRTILFTAGPLAGPGQVYSVGLDGGPERQITFDTDSASDASWSPDGTKFAYMRAGTGDGPVVAIADPTGKILKILRGQYGWHQPIWSPDGSKIIATDDHPGPANEDGAAIRVILDAADKLPPIEIPAPGLSPGDLPDWAGTWQRLAP